MNVNVDIQLLIAKNENAFKQLVEGYKNLVYNTSIGILQNTQDAEEITQDVFIEVYQSIANFDQRSALSTWIYRIAVNKSLDKLRHNKRKKRFGFIERLFQRAGNDPIVDRPHFIHPGVELEQKELSGILFSALTQLPEKQKTAYVLCHIEGLPYKEIAAIMQTTESSVESLLFRAKENLRKLLNTYYQKNYK